LTILENFHRNLRAIPALATLGSLLAEEERHPELLHLFKTRLVEPRRALLRQALAAGDLPDSADLDALTSMLIGSFYGRYVTIAGIPDDWPDRVLSAIWPPDTSPAPRSQSVTEIGRPETRTTRKTPQSDYALLNVIALTPPDRQPGSASPSAAGQPRVRGKKPRGRFWPSGPCLFSLLVNFDLV
jgi:hypothetical protein